MLRTLLMSVVLLDCGNTNTTKKESKAQRASDAPIPCETDKDCPPIACGPCTPGEVLTDDNSGFNCTENPCLDGGAVCSADKVCVVRPGAKRRPPRDDAKPQ